jgi:hypothetical protein
MGGDFKVGDKARVAGRGEGVIIGQCPWWEPGAEERESLGMRGIPASKVRIVRLAESGKVVSSIEESGEVIAG